MERGAPISYRGMAVGKVSSVSLAEDAASVRVNAVVDEQYRHLVRSNSQFWHSGGVGMKFGWRQGFDLDIDTLRSLAVGGVTFATPPSAGDPVTPGQTFELLEEEVEGWESWGPMRLDGPAQSSVKEEGGFFRNLRTRFQGEGEAAKEDSED